MIKSPHYIIRLDARQARIRAVDRFAGALMFFLVVGSIWLLNWQLLATAAVVLVAWGASRGPVDHQTELAKWQNRWAESDNRANLAESRLRTLELEHQLASGVVPDPREIEVATSDTDHNPWTLEESE